MRILVDIDTCTCCQLCYEEAPEVFANRGDGYPLVIMREVIPPFLEKVVWVAEACPSGSILLEG
ncbi:hypothetical protein Thal_1158 [Thermocrinis albus DSM 14484]|uniref:Ferredoxin n=1 Tax=Thermocrinis albus (strain DSM 14484 / JCM 11386 / HI 11/12) TaxID=638303 RepID=D3SM10_THEAH|nr:ferredoxin [Thermocrinis albus]ADC89790.1 hypothetical protein Thal_1158 [Thermocrinis albus DSM 14484]